MGYKVIIADDEPLVLIGLEDMVDWAEAGFEIIAEARNGAQLLDQIEENDPDLVITDIKMPVKSGIEVLEEIKKDGRSLPLFIFLTSFEEFDFVKQAISLDAIDYLVKLELEKDELLSALERAKKKIEEKRGRRENIAVAEKHVLQERYLMRLLFALDTEDIKAEDVGLDLSFPYFAVSYIAFPPILEAADKDKSVSLFYGAARLMRETINRYTPCYVIQLDLGHIAAIFPFSEKTRNGYRSYINSAFKTAEENLKDYFSLSANVSVGPIVNDLHLISESFFKAKLLFAKEERENKTISFFDYRENKDTSVSNIVLDAKSFNKAFSELNTELLEEATANLIKTIRDEHVTVVHAIDVSSSLLYMAMNAIPSSSQILEEIFPSEENMLSYRVLYQARSGEDVILWIERFSSGLERVFKERKQDYREQTMQKIQAYIRENVTGNLDLASVASIFGYSKNYLSSLFTRYSSMSFVDYVNTAKIERAKILLANPNAMVYEVASELGYDSQFYFSKVFKKITGISPTTYQRELRESKEQ